jgi:outer membrane protein assembly factor BamB
MSGGAPAVDSSGSLYLTTGNGSFDDVNSVLPPLAPNNDFSMSFLKFNPMTLAVQDFYTPSNESFWSSEDWDISSSGTTVLPDGIGPSGHPNLLVGSDKQSHLWLIDRAAMGEFNSVTNNTVQYLTLPNSSDCGDVCVYATPAYYNATVYIAYSNGSVLALPLANGLVTANAQAIAVPSSMSAELYPFPSPTPSISASPTGNALLWVLDNSLYQGNANASKGAAVLRAYDASNLGKTLYSSSALSADSGGNAVKFTVPVIANGHVYVGGGQQLTVYGLSP